MAYFIRTICLIPLLTFFFHAGIYGQIWVDRKEYNINEIDVDELARLAGADTLPLSKRIIKGQTKPTSLVIKDVTLKPYFDKLGDVINPTFQVPKHIKKIGLMGCKTQGEVHFESNGDNFSIWLGSCVSEIKIHVLKGDTVSVHVRESELKTIMLDQVRNADVFVVESNILSDIGISNSNVSLTITDSNLKVIELFNINFKPDTIFRSFFSIYDTNIDKLLVSESTFNTTTSERKPSGENEYEIFIGHSQIKTASFENSDIPSINFNGSSISKSIGFGGSTIRGLGVLNFDLPPTNIDIPFDKLSGEKLFLLGDAISKPYFAKTTEDVLNKTAYNDLLNAYTKFHRTYKERGDIESANLCYIEMKQIEGKRLKALYENEKSLERYFAWQLNRFLNWFCDYGTNPVKSLVYAIYVIALFSILYFLFPSEQDNLNRQRIYSFFGKAVEYFKTDKQLTQIHQDERQHEIDALEKFSNTVKESKGTVPPIVWFLGSPLYKLGIAYNKILIWALTKSDVVKGRWEDLSRAKRFRIGALISVYFIGFLLVGVLMRTFNALALSLNAFVTLGYGEISAKGIARYLAVLEGVTGWFLLSIFSVSLISQILA